MKIRPVRDKLFHAERGTDMTKVIVAFFFWNFANAPKNITKPKNQYTQSELSSTDMFNVLIYSDFVLYCGRVPAANAPGCTAAEGLFYKSWSLVFPTSTARCLHQRPY